MRERKIEFEFEKATKNKYRFQENKSGGHYIATSYVKKSVFGSSEPKKAKITVEWK